MARPFLQSARRSPSYQPAFAHAASEAPSETSTGRSPCLAGPSPSSALRPSLSLQSARLRAANAIFLQYTAPIFVAFFGIHYLRESVGKLDWLALAAVL